MIYRIPKKARNKYGFVKGMSAGANMNNISMALSISGGGGGGLGLSSVNANTIGSNPQIVSAINNGIQKEIDDGNLITASYLSSYYVTASELSNMAYVTASELSNAGYVTNSALVQASYVTQPQLSACSYATTTQLSTMIDDAKLYADQKANQDSTEAKNQSMSYTETKVNDMKNEIDNELANYAWPVGITTSDYTVAAMEVGTMRPVFINSSSTVNLTMPGDSTQQYVILAMNVITSVLVAAGKNPRYIAATGGSSTAISWTSSAEPYMLCLVVRLS